MRPSRSFLLLLIFLVCFTGLHYLLPFKSYFPEASEFTGEEVINLLCPDNKSDTVLPDTIINSSVELSDSATIADSGTPGFLSSDSPLKTFMDSLSESREQIRIMYYGDSQIEGDRITSLLRQSLRAVSQGTGPGLFLPVMPVMYTKSVWVRSSPNWQRYNYLSYADGTISHRMFGPAMALCRYLPEGVTSQAIETAFVRIRPSTPADSLVSVYDRLRVLYRSTEGAVNISVQGDDAMICNDTLARTGRISEFSCTLNDPEEITILFSGNVSPDIYGISIESSSGIVLDNIPQRGSAGLEFTMVDRQNLRESYAILDPDLIFLHYGLNIVKNIRNDYTYYSRGLIRQLNLLRETADSIPVILVGLTDMAGGRSDSIRSFKNIPSIISAQRNAADSAGAIFWDSWNAMGGESSIISWAGKNPPLAQKDLVHLTYDGADTLASIMAESLFFSYDKHPGFADDTIEKVETFIPEEELRDERGKIQVLISSVFSYDPDDPMIFTTAAFWLFLLIVMIFYSLLYKKLVLRNFYLFLISLFFYYKSGGLFLGLLILVTVIDFVNGLIIGTSGKKSVRKLFIVLSILSNIGILGYFKYSVFIADSLNSLLGTEIKAHDFLADLSNLYLGTGFNVSNIILPVGISFFTFQSLSYTIDVYRRKISPVRNIIDFGFFVSFFPQLVAGPIVRASEFVPQIYAPYHLGKREFSHAAFLICKGLIKKIIISDFISVNFIDRVFDAPSMYSGFENIMAVYGYGLQIYCDFSGYTDIAIGVGLLFGFRLPLNFNSPYKAAGISDFWRRWHISLSRWLKDYLYIPLGGNRKGKIRTYINLILTMTIGGLWHGANLRFVIWGFLHGIGLIFDRLVKNIYGNRSRGRLVSFLGIFLTFNFVNFCWIFFRAADLENVRIMISQMIHSFSPGSWGVALLTYSNVFLLILAGYVLHFIPEDVKESYRGLFIRVPIAAQMVVILFVAVLLYRMSSADTMPFIYFRF